MTVGLATANANSALSTLITGADFVKLHTGDPGSAGTSNASAETTRKSVTWGSPSAAAVAASGTPVAQWTSWAAGSETLTHVSLWSASSGGTFKFSAALTVSKPVTNGDTFNLLTLTLSAAPIAA